jgi:hypothetical protein
VGVKYTKTQYESIFGQLKLCFANAALTSARAEMYKLNCKESNLKELFLYVWALNDVEFNFLGFKETYLTEKEFNNIISKVLSICDCNV